LVAEEDILALSGVLIHVEHALEDPQEIGAIRGGGGGAMLERVEGGAEVEGTSLKMVGSIGAWGFMMSVMNISLTNVMLVIFSIITII
jgi:hypothetical protein